MSKKRMYRQTVQLRDTDGIKVTMLLSETNSEYLDLQVWSDPRTSMAAIAHTLMLLAKSVSSHSYIVGTLEEVIKFSEAKLIDGKHESFPEGQVVPSDDLPF